MVTNPSTFSILLVEYSWSQFSWNKTDALQIYNIALFWNELARRNHALLGFLIAIDRESSPCLDNRSNNLQIINAKLTDRWFACFYNLFEVN